MSFLPFLILFKTESESGLLRRELRGLLLPEQVQPATPVRLRHTTLPIRSLCLLSSYYVTGTKFYMIKLTTRTSFYRTCLRPPLNNSYTSRSTKLSEGKLHKRVAIEVKWAWCH